MTFISQEIIAQKIYFEKLFCVGEGKKGATRKHKTEHPTLDS